MNFFKEAHSAFDFAKYYPLLCKAIADNDTTTPGYTFEEIIKISFLSHQHRIHLVDFLLSRLTNLGWSGKQKVIRILLQLCKKGHFEIRLILRQRDGDLRKAASLGGPPDPVLANTPQLFFNSAIQELLSYIFDPNVMKLDEEISHKGKEPDIAGPAVGYGSSANHGKYDGFGNSPINKQENFVDQVVEFVGKVVPSEAHKREALEGFLKTEKGNFQPFSLSSTIPLPPSVSASKSFNQQQSSSIPPLYKSIISPRNKGHVAGKVGGGWDSDEDEEEETLTAKLASISSILPAHAGEEKLQNENFIKTLLDEHQLWPVDYETFVSKCKECTIYNPFELLNDVSKEIKLNKTEMESAEDIIEKSPKKDDDDVTSSKASHNILILLLFIEYCLNEDLLSVNLLSTHLPSLLNEICLQEYAPKSVKMKSKKINLILKSLSTYS